MICFFPDYIFLVFAYKNNKDVLLYMTLGIKEYNLWDFMDL